MITLPQLKVLAKQNKISFTGRKKDELIRLLIDKNVITPSDLIDTKFVVVEPVKKDEEDQGRYEYLKKIRNNPKNVEIFDKVTGETRIFPSIYKTGRGLGINTAYIKDGTTWKNRYQIKVL